MIFSQAGTKILIENGFRYIREEGLKPLLSRILRITFSPLFRCRKEVFCIRNLGHPVMIKMSGLQLVFEEISLNEAEDLQKIMYLGTQEIKKWLLNGKRCFVAKVAGKIVHYSWVSFGTGYVDVINKTIKLAEDEAYIHTCRTLPAHRGKGIYPFTLNKICEHLRLKGYSKAITCANFKNTSSIKSFEKAGFKKVGEVTYSKIFLFTKYRHQGILPWVS